jgi:hypothetical protein
MPGVAPDTGQELTKDLIEEIKDLGRDRCDALD